MTEEVVGLQLYPAHLDKKDPVPDLTRPSIQSEVNVIHRHSINGGNEPFDSSRPAFWVSEVTRWLHILFQMSIIFLSATVSHIDSVLKVYPQFVCCILPCAAFSVILISLLLVVDWCFFSVFYLLLTVSVFFTFFPSSSVFWLGLLSGALWGNVCSLCLSIYPCACLHFCIFYLSQPVSFTEFIEAAALLSSQLNVLNKCHIFLFCFSYQHSHSHNKRCWHLVCLCYVTVFVLHLYWVT